MSNSNIEWTDKVWNPVTGCTKVSQGCKNCYAKTLHDKRHKAFLAGKLQNVKQYSVPFETVMLHPKRLADPLKWKKPTKIFVNSMSDLFHEDVPFEFISSVFSVMSDCDQHIFQVLTKRPKRMLDFYHWKYRQFGVPWRPSDNVWIGVSVENQETANERIHHIKYINASVKFLSCEPLLGPIDFEKAIGDSLKWHIGGLKNCISWVIVGGESGPNARPMHPDWARSLRDQCAAAGVSFFFKQWGEWAPVEDVDPSEDIVWLDYKSDELKERKNPIPHICINHDGKTSQVANDVISSGEKNQILYRFGKHISGSTLDGKQHLEFPKR
jgi:protein gp37